MSSNTERIVAFFQRIFDGISEFFEKVKDAHWRYFVKSLGIALGLFVSLKTLEWLSPIWDAVKSFVGWTGSFLKVDLIGSPLAV